MAKNSKKGTSKKKAYKKKATTKKYTKNKTLVKFVRKQIALTEEIKHREYSGAFLPNTYNSSAQDSNIFPLSPYASVLDIQQGTSDGSRIGNRIKLKHGSISMTILPTPQNATTNITPVPQHVVFVIFYDKLADTDIPTPYNNGDFFQNNGSTSGFSGNLSDTYRWINYDRYKVFYKRVFKVGFQYSNGTGNVPTMEYYSNNDYKMTIVNFKVNFTKWLYHNVKYNDNNSTPTTRGLFCMWYTVPCDGNLFGSTQKPLSVNYQMRLSYTDS